MALSPPVCPAGADAGEGHAGSDPRSRKVAVVADSLLETLLGRLEEEGYGVIQLPPAGLDPETASLWLEQTAEHVAEFVRNDYEVVLADDGECGDALHAALSGLRVGALPPYPTEAP